MAVLVNPDFWTGLVILGVVAFAALVYTKKVDLLNNTVVAVTISVLVALGYFHIVNHYLMDFQGLDYWYLFRD